MTTENNNDLNFATISVEPSTPAPFVPDYYVRILNDTYDMNAITHAIKAAGLRAQTSVERWGDNAKSYDANHVNILEGDTRSIVAVINGLGYQTDEDETDDDEDDDEDEVDESDPFGW